VARRCDSCCLGAQPADALSTIIYWRESTHRNIGPFFAKKQSIDLRVRQVYYPGMGTGVARALVLACSLVVALPQGWCCVFADCFAAQTTQTTVPPVSACCHCCEQKPPPSPSPVEQPSAPCPSRCLCTDRHAVLGQKQSVDQPELEIGFVAILHPLVIDQRLGSEVNGFVSVVHPPTNRLHVSKCLWLC
jgi:hypothetical protein